MNRMNRRRFIAGAVVLAGCASGDGEPTATGTGSPFRMVTRIRAGSPGA